MSRIGPTPGPDPARGPQGPQAPTRPSGPAGEFRVPPPAPGAGQTPPPLTQGEYTRLRQRILASVAEGKAKDQVLHDLVQETARDRFGEGATPEMAASITRAFETDPHLKRLFAELFRTATA